MELVVGKVLAIFLLMAAGFGVGRLKVLPEGSNTTLNVLLIKVITPGSLTPPSLKNLSKRCKRLIFLSIS